MVLKRFWIVRASGVKRKWIQQSTNKRRFPKDLGFFRPQEPKETVIKINKNYDFQLIFDGPSIGESIQFCRTSAGVERK